MLNINGTLMRICHPASWRGSGLITTPYPGLTPWAMILSPLRAQVSARLRPAKLQFVELYGEPKVSGIQKPRVNGATAHSAGQAAKRRRPGYSVKNIQKPRDNGVTA